ncbi:MULTISPECIES: response regulator transcription factor [unclassified Moraxella]|uniref:response regulator transcription factor n=1 Tax=unclassified Moraxella TaxID=2685852 RepID=UPI003AF9E462
MIKLLLIDDDVVFCQLLAKSLGKKGFECQVAHEPMTALSICQTFAPQVILLDLNLGDTNGMQLIEPLLGIVPTAKIVILTGYASIATAVSAVKLGAYHYLPKPCRVEEILQLLNDAPPTIEPVPTPERLSLDHLEWEYIHQVLADCEGNISEAARVLKMHRRTLQRKLQKKRKVNLE